MTLGTFRSIGYGVFVYSQQGTKINKLIEDKYEYVLLSTVRGADNKDKSYWNNYKTESEKLDNDIFGLTDWDKLRKPDLTEKLKEKCKELAETTFYDEGKELYQKVTKYFTREVAFAE